ncbi:hypothetical protein ACHHYP_08480 [Achlya hypogyna]|uniref:NET domain-containing protein n=1 Tax=Achlya hypogyna TaxID=1202772 RepID=A0A1V9YPK1_ACHHY|nr:hypothetical protein ACHHYP_08480 [Achlya hypogyna]
MLACLSINSQCVAPQPPAACSNRDALAALVHHITRLSSCDLEGLLFLIAHYEPACVTGDDEADLDLEKLHPSTLMAIHDYVVACHRRHC